MLMLIIIEDFSHNFLYQWDDHQFARHFRVLGAVFTDSYMIPFG